MDQQKPAHEITFDVEKKEIKEKWKPKKILLNQMISNYEGKEKERQNGNMREKKKLKEERIKREWRNKERVKKRKRKNKWKKSRKEIENKIGKLRKKWMIKKKKRWTNKMKKK